MFAAVSTDHVPEGIGGQKSWQNKHLTSITGHYPWKSLCYSFHYFVLLFQIASHSVKEQTIQLISTQAKSPISNKIPAISGMWGWTWLSSFSLFHSIYPLQPLFISLSVFLSSRSIYLATRRAELKFVLFDFVFSAHFISPGRGEDSESRHRTLVPAWTRFPWSHRARGDQGADKQHWISW